MSSNLENKKQVVSELMEKIKNSKSVVFVDYKGLTAAEVTELRCSFRKADVEYKVLKNTLVRKAFNELGITDFDSDLNGPTAVAFGKDETGAAKIVIEAAKKVLYTGHIGDGIIFVYNVDRVVKVRTGEEDTEALQDVE